MSTQPTEAQCVAFANGLAWMLLRHAKNLTPKDRKLIETVRDAKTVDEMRTASAYAAAYAQKCAVKAGVPEHEVTVLRMTCLGE